MSRYRPPVPASTPIISGAGFERLKQELDDLWRRRRVVTAALAAAAAEGDRSENAEYIYRKKELRDEAGDHRVVRIVGPDEIDPSTACISIDSVMARALLKASVGDDVEVAAPRGTQFYEVLDIKY